MPMRLWHRKPVQRKALDSESGIHDQAPSIEQQRAIGRQKEVANRDAVEQALVALNDDSRFNGVLEFYWKVKNQLRSDILAGIIKYGIKARKVRTDKPDAEPIDHVFKYMVTARSLSEALDKLSEDLCTSSSGLKICAITAGSFTGGSPYPISSRLWHWLSGQQTEARLAFQTVLWALLMEIWGHNWQEKQIIAAMGFNPVISVSHVALDPISSYRRGAWLPLDPQSLVTLRYRPEIGDWNETMYLQWQWLSKAPQYISDFSVYIRQLYSEDPKLDYIRLVVLRNVASDRSDLYGSREIVVVASSSEVLLRFWNNLFGPGATSKIQPDVDSQLLGFMCSLYRLVFSDTTQFVLEISKYIADLDYRRRKAPSASKHQYLLHLEDTIIHVAKATESSVKLIDRVLSSVLSRLPNNEQCFNVMLDDLNDYKEDFGRLSEPLNHRLALIRDIRDKMKDQMQYSDRLRSMMIGVLVAVYVPLSFATGLFGMNITAPQDHNQPYYTQTWFGYDWWAYNETWTWTDTNEPRTQTWDISTFFATAVPLTLCTIVIPITAGPLLRALSRFRRRHTTWVRVLTRISLSLGALLAPVAFFWDYTDASVYAFGALVFLLSGWQVAVTWSSRREHRKRLALWVICLVMDVVMIISTAGAVGEGRALQFPLSIIMEFALIVMWLRGNLVLKRRTSRS